MKSLFTLFISLFFSIGYGQWMDHFTGSWPSAGWNGDDDAFIINSNQQLQSQFNHPGFFQLQHDLIAPGNVQEFSCFIRQNFAGSSNNFGRILLYNAGNPDSVGHNNNAQVQGWVIQWGNAGSADLIQIFWNDGAIWEPIAEAFPIANGVYGHFKMVQDTMVHFYFQDNDSSQYHPLLHAAIPTGFSVSKVCLQAQCTSSNMANFFWDDVYFGAPIVPLQEMNTGKRSVVINEVLPDPDPPSAAGISEFIELYNPSPDSILLMGWTLYNTSTAHTLPSRMIPPNGYAILCQMEDTIHYSGRCWGLTSFSALTNTGDSLTLCSADGSIVDIFQYDIQTYKNAAKTDGGWSLEQRNATLPCSGEFNWAACIDPSGATPGAINSLDDLNFQAPTMTLTDWGIDLEQRLYLWSNLPWDQDSIRISIENQWTTLPCLSSHDSLIIPLPSHSETIQIRIDSVSFCQQSLPSFIELDVPFIQPYEGETISFNEILFHPSEGQFSFVELYNNGESHFSLDHFWIENQSGSLYGVQNHHHFIGAHQYLALSEGGLSSPCAEVHCHQVKNLPYLTISEGTVYLGYTFYKLDTLTYNENMHHPYLSETQGVSLERVEGDLSQETWLSSSAQVGGQTPGCPNSQQWNYSISSSTFQCTPEYFSPNQDGRTDVIAFTYQGSQVGVEAQLRILSQEGYEMAQLCQSEWLGTSAQWTWDGRTQEGSLCSPGLYFALLEIADGQSHQSAKTIKSFVLSP
jgi:hypothetical protein